MPNVPAWKDDFPINWVDDHFVTRREFTKSLVLVSGAALAANGTLLALAAARKGEAAALPAARVAGADEVPVGGSKVFDYPGPGERCLLVRLDAERFAAFRQNCTHLGCPVVFRPGQQCLYCPCHEGFFDAADGRVLSGPPPRPLPRVSLETRGDGLWATGIAV